MNEILVINGNPDPNSLSAALAESYKLGVTQAGGECHIIHLHELKFDPNLRFGYKKIMLLEPDLEMAQVAIKKAKHLVFIYPVWWGTYPALLKGFIDRTFLPGFAFNGKSDSVYWEKLLKGKTGRIIESLDAPTWFYNDIYKSPGKNSLSIAVMNFCGIKPVAYTVFTPVKVSLAEDRQQWVIEAEQLGMSDFNLL
jgi:putative NADPH-quinone reductase